MVAPKQPPAAAPPPPAAAAAAAAKPADPKAPADLTGTRMVDASILCKTLGRMCCPRCAARAEQNALRAFTNFLKAQDDDNQDDYDRLLKRYKASMSGSGKAYQLKSLLVVTEEYRTGFAPTWRLRCRTKSCAWTELVELTPRSGGGPKAHHSSWDVNLRMALGMLTTGNGPAHWELLAATLNLPLEVGWRNNAALSVMETVEASLIAEADKSCRLERLAAVARSESVRRV